MLFARSKTATGGAGTCKFGHSAKALIPFLAPLPVTEFFQVNRRVALTGLAGLLIVISSKIPHRDE
jgi:hypothetical protein